MSSRLLPSHYLACKASLLREAGRRGGALPRGEARSMFRLDPGAGLRIYDLLASCGWLHEPEAPDTGAPFLHHPASPRVVCKPERTDGKRAAWCCRHGCSCWRRGAGADGLGVPRKQCYECLASYRAQPFLTGACVPWCACCLWHSQCLPSTHCNKT